MANMQASTAADALYVQTHQQDLPGQPGAASQMEERKNSLADSTGYADHTKSMNYYKMQYQSVLKRRKSISSVDSNIKAPEASLKYLQMRKFVPDYVANHVLSAADFDPDMLEPYYDSVQGGTLGARSALALLCERCRLLAPRSLARSLFFGLLGLPAATHQPLPPPTPAHTPPHRTHPTPIPL